MVQLTGIMGADAVATIAILVLVILFVNNDDHNGGTPRYA